MEIPFSGPVVPVRGTTRTRTAQRRRKKTAAKTIFTTPVKRAAAPLPLDRRIEFRLGRGHSGNVGGAAHEKTQAEASSQKTVAARNHPRSDAFGRGVQDLAHSARVGCDHWLRRDQHFRAAATPAKAAIRRVPSGKEGSRGRGDFFAKSETPALVGVPAGSTRAKSHGRGRTVA